MKGSRFSLQAKCRDILYIKVVLSSVNKIMSIFRNYRTEYHVLIFKEWKSDLLLHFLTQYWYIYLAYIIVTSLMVIFGPKGKSTLGYFSFLTSHPQPMLTTTKGDINTGICSGRSYTV